MVEGRLVSLLLNHLSLVEQDTLRKYVGCGRFSVLHLGQIFKTSFWHQYATSNSFPLKLYYIGSHMHSQTAYFLVFLDVS